MIQLGIGKVFMSKTAVAVLKFISANDWSLSKQSDSINGQNRSFRYSDYILCDCM